MLRQQAKRRKYVTGTDKIATTIYILPRHRKHIEFLMHATGTSMTDCICRLIDQSIKSYTVKRVI